MANAKKCDRCGVFFEKNLCVERFAIKKYAMQGGIVYDVDLCDCCWGDFMKFITGTPIASEEEEE